MNLFRDPVPISPALLLTLFSEGFGGFGGTQASTGASFAGGFGASSGGSFGASTGTFNQNPGGAFGQASTGGFGQSTGRVISCLLLR